MSHVLRAKIMKLEEQLEAEREAHRKTQEAHSKASTAWYYADQEVQRLRDEVEAFSEWDHLRERDDDGGLPVPRLEIRWDPDESMLDRDGEPAEWFANYALIFQHLLGHYVEIPLGQTRSSGGPHFGDGERLDTPFRDGAHIRHDALELDLPAYVVHGDRSERIDPTDHSGVVGRRKSRGKPATTPERGGEGE